MEPEKPKMRLDQRVTPAAGMDQMNLSAQRPAGVEFASVEDMLRQDRDATRVPEGIADRLDASVGQLPPPVPWWRRLLGGGP
jgi:hypothetical protein